MNEKPTPDLWDAFFGARIASVEKKADTVPELMDALDALEALCKEFEKSMLAKDENPNWHDIYSDAIALIERVYGRGDE